MNNRSQDTLEDVTEEYKNYDNFQAMALQECDRLTYHDGLHNGPHFLVERKKV